MDKNVPAVAAYISGRLEEVAIENDIQTSDAWSRVAAQMLGYDLETLEFFAARDIGIDFYYRSDRTFEVFQCKMHDPDEAGHLNLEKPFGPEGFSDLQRAAEFLLGELMPSGIDPRLLSLREQLREELSLVPEENDDQEEPPNVSLVLHLITLGDKLTPASKTAAATLRKRLKDLARTKTYLAVSAEHNGITELAEFFENPDIAPKPVNPVRLRLAADVLKFKQPGDAEIRTVNFVTFYTRATDLVSASRREGPALFDANVRYELASSNINEEIRRTALYSKGMRLFHLYNNGVTITATGWTYRDNGHSIELRNAAVINGCQTVRTLARVKKELEENAEENPRLLKDFDESCLILVRLVKNDFVERDAIVRAANTQNAMEPRNLLSNRTEQRAMEKEFAEFGWFYERKDGSTVALREAGYSSLGIPLSKFQVRLEKKGPKTLRSCDNREVARRWLSFFGYSYEGKNERRHHFPLDGKGLYERIFLTTPKSHRDTVRLSGSTETDPPIVPGRPPAVWLLYAYHLFELIRHLLPVATKIRARVKRELTQAGKETTLSAVNQRILGDEATRLAFALSMLDHVVLELAGFAIARALRENWLAPLYGRRLLQVGAIGHFQEFAKFPEELHREGLLDINPSHVSADPALIAIRLGVQAIEARLGQPEYCASFLSAERKSLYLQSDTILRSYAEMLDQYDQYLARPGNFVAWWSGGSPIKAISVLMK